LLIKISTFFWSDRLKFLAVDEKIKQTVCARFYKKVHNKSENPFKTPRGCRPSKHLQKLLLITAKTYEWMDGHCRKFTNEIE